jgi:hypothetical protein
MGGHGGDLSNCNSSAEDEKIDEIIRGLPEGSGMRGKTDCPTRQNFSNRYIRVIYLLTF